MDSDPVDFRQYCFSIRGQRREWESCRQIQPASQRFLAFSALVSGLLPFQSSLQLHGHSFKHTTIPQSLRLGIISQVGDIPLIVKLPMRFRDKKVCVGFNEQIAQVARSFADA